VPMPRKGRKRALAAMSPDTRRGLNRARKLIQGNPGAKLQPFQEIAPRGGPSRTLDELKRAYREAYPFVWEFWRSVCSKAGTNGDGEAYQAAGWAAMMEWHRVHVSTTEER
jgi:hypothetical protein